ncbi:hypothetical protein [Marimonas arenosa]|uniref:Uncharacterized protein n=1 Tax=Marimonas arenosa TaxID=1795305 RepID=A0AAE4B564_9RHOB|nr:hypothetical protein [Marimonas arenosa]MDQ2090950.1 hypothetical protein [Marimonas arenosa]
MALAVRTFALALATATGASAATFGELSGAGPVGMNTMGMAPAYAAGPYAGAPVYCPPNCIPPGYGAGMMSGVPGGMAGPGAMPRRGGPEGVPPGDPGASPEGPFVPALAANPRAYMPFRSYADGPNSPMMLWSFGQYNSGTDPYNPYGLSTPYMRVPWSTPLAGWTNSQTWNWWRERSGALPRNW